MDHVTSLAARIEPLPVITLSRTPRTPFWLVALICSLSWSMAMLSLLTFGVSAYYGLTRVDQQIAWDSRR